MDPLIFSPFTNGITNSNNITSKCKIPETKADSFELSTDNSKPVNNKKKIMLIAGGIALAAAGCITVVKVHNLNKAKKEITQLYNNIFEDMNKQIKDVINFEKPGLVFKRLRKGFGGGYIPAQNKIVIDPRRLRKTCIIKNLKNTTTTEIAKGLKIADGEINTGVFQIIRKGLGNEYRMASKNEALAITGATLSHELTHAKQFQVLLSTEGGLKKYISALKSQGLTDKLIKEHAPFIFSYKPKKLLSNKTILVENLTKGKQLKYDFNHLLEAFTKYVQPGEDKLGYYTNLAEISARNGEEKYWGKVLNGKLPRNNISDDFIKHFHASSIYNTEVLAKAAARK